MWFGALALAIALVAGALRLRPPLPRSTGASSAPSPAFLRPAPGPWRLRLVGMASTIAFFFVIWGTPGLIPFAPAALLLIVGLDAAVAWQVTRWSRRPGWDAQQRLALATGAASFFLLLAPILERNHPAGKNTSGITLVALVWLAFFIWLAHRLGRRVPETIDEPEMLVEQPTSNVIAGQ